MLQSKLFYKTQKTARHDAGASGGEKTAVSHELLVRAGFVDQLMAGVYTFLPLGFMVLKKIENIIRKNMLEVGGQEMLMPALNPKENWQKTGRWETLDILFKLRGAGDREYALAPTHEEVVSPLAKKIILSYKDLPFYIFHIQDKFRNELRAKSGILRTREFVMKDLYSFHATQEDLDNYYVKVAKVYKNIFKVAGLGKQTFETLASGGTFSKYSHEYQTITDAGEDTIFICKKCGFSINEEIADKKNKCPNCGITEYEQKKAIEVGNIFKLGTKYSLPFGLKYKDKSGKEMDVYMGCYGIGLSRLMGAIVEINHDDNGIIWPKEVAPFSVHLIPVEESVKVKRTAEKICKDLSGIEVLYDDRKDKTTGEKFAEADLIGIPYRVVVSEKTLARGCVEVKERGKKQLKAVKIKQLPKIFNFQ